MTIKIYIVILIVLILVISIETSNLDFKIKYINGNGNGNSNNDRVDDKLNKQRRYLKKNYPTPSIKKKIGDGNDDNDDEVVYRTLSPTASSEHTLSPTPHSLDHETPNPSEQPTTNPYSPTRSPTEPPDETNGIIVVSVVFGSFLLGVLYFKYIKPNFISKKKVELSEMNNSSNNNKEDHLDLSTIYGNDDNNAIKPVQSKDSLSLIGSTWTSKTSFDERDPLIPKNTRSKEVR